MFTGIVEATGILETLRHTAEGGRLVVRLPARASAPAGAPESGAPEIAGALRPGSSLAVNGCCLTVVELGNGAFAMDLSGETLRRTAFGEMKPGQRLNLERPLRAGAELGGHFVQGHVDGIGRVTRLVPARPAGGPEIENRPGSSADRQDPGTIPESKEKCWWLSVHLPGELGRYVAMKGSIAIDGISLTVAGWNDGIADFAVIPFTYAQTNVRDLTVGDPVNIECDILAKYLERLIQASKGPAPSRLTREELLRQGF
jgi:riboflavin synthase